MKNYIVIMAGGVGSRFWPASREEKPKQFLDILGIGKSLIRLTYERFLKVTDPDKIFVVTNKKYRPLVKEHIPEMSDNQIMGEPSRNNTAPCVAYASLKIYDLDPDANLVMAPSDHFIADEDEFVRVIRKGLEFTASGEQILTLGMKPHNPATGYGYIELGESIDNEICAAEAFKEKPDVETAQKYLDVGTYVWNSGIFLFSAKTILKSFSDHANDIFSILIKGAEEYNTDKEEEFLGVHYPTTPNISIDYAIMEKANNVFCFPADFGWTDLGTWGSLYDFMEKDERGNVVLGKSSQAIVSSGNLIVVRDGKKICMKDIDDYFIIDTKDFLVIWPRRDELQITELRKKFC